MKGFRTIKITDDFVPEERDIPLFPDKSCVASAPHARSGGAVFLTGDALADLDDHIRWGQHLPQNRVEQGGFMLGNVYRDPVTHSVFAIVERLVPIHGAQGSAAYLDMSVDATYEAQQEEQRIFAQHEGPLRRVGWYHTHPGNLGVFMSGTDLHTQAHSYSRDWQFAVVLNPQRRIWRGFRGAAATEVNCVFVCDPADPRTAVFLPRTRGDGFRVSPAPAAPQDHTVRVDGDSIHVGSWTMAADTFMEQLLSGIHINGMAAKLAHLVLHVRFRLREEDGRLRFCSLALLRQYINLICRWQLSLELDHDEDPEGVYAILHFMSFDEAEVHEKMSAAALEQPNAILCVIDRKPGGKLRYYLCDRERDYVIHSLGPSAEEEAR